MMNAEEARNLILTRLKPGNTLTVSLEQSAGRVLAEEITTGMDLPSFDNAAMDGYAVRSEDVRSVPVTLRVVGEVPAGSVRTHRLSVGEAFAIMTGARIPEGADAVVQLEWTTGSAQGDITINRVVDRGLNIRRRGTEITAGKSVLAIGSILRPQEIGLLATLGQRFVQVFASPRVAILTTGNELVDTEKPLKEGQLRNSNKYMLTALVRETGGDPVFLGNAHDTEDELRAMITLGLTYDVLITSGGISVGKYDLVTRCLESEGYDIGIKKVNIKPGMPFVFGMREQTAVFGLPGNPVSAMVTFHQFVRPGLRALRGESHPGRRLTVMAHLVHDLKKTDGKRHFIRAKVEREGEKFIVRSTGPQGSGMMTSLTAANALLVLPENREEFRAGELVEVELLP